MSITFRCEHCGKKVEAPDAAGGRRGKCPYCKQTCYIPAPVSDEDLYGLSPEDEAEEQRARREKERLLAEEEALISEMGEKEPAAEPLAQRKDVKPAELHHFVVNYCLDLMASNLERAETHAAGLRKFGKQGVAAVDEFLKGKALEPALDAIPSKVLQGFLKQLRDSLR